MNVVGPTCVGSNPVIGTIIHKQIAKSVVHPSEVGKWVLSGNSEDTCGDAATPHRLGSYPHTQPVVTSKNT